MLESFSASDNKQTLGNKQRKKEAQVLAEIWASKPGYAYDHQEASTALVYSTGVEAAETPSLWEFDGKRQD
jgi:hypothetical protein